ncbi:hypothetical protein OAN00_07695, partial [Pseudomonadales bacterium]|nr:hypothetical protein [Pseudomonadales bacterium]
APPKSLVWPRTVTLTRLLNETIKRKAEAVSGDSLTGLRLNQRKDEFLLSGVQGLVIGFV